MYAIYIVNHAKRAQIWVPWFQLHESARHYSGPLRMKMKRTVGPLRHWAGSLDMGLCRVLRNEVPGEGLAWSP